MGGYVISNIVRLSFEYWDYIAIGIIYIGGFIIGDYLDYDALKNTQIKTFRSKGIDILNGLLIASLVIGLIIFIITIKF